MPQTIALQARAPQINPAKILSDSYALEDQRNQSQLNRFKLEDYQQTRGTAIESTIAKHRASISGADRDIYDDRLYDMARRAAPLLALPKNSPQRLEGWNSDVQDYFDKGWIDQNQYERWFNNPSDLVLQQAVDAGRTIEAVAGRGKGQRTVAQSDTNNRYAMGQANERHNELYPRVDSMGDEIEYSPEQIAQQKKEWQTDFERFRSQLQGNAASADAFAPSSDGVGFDQSLSSPTSEVPGSFSGDTGVQVDPGDSVAQEHDFTGMSEQEALEIVKTLPVGTRIIAPNGEPAKIQPRKSSFR